MAGNGGLHRLGRRMGGKAVPTNRHCSTCRCTNKRSACLAVLLACGALGVRGIRPRVEVIHPEAEEAVLQASGTLLLKLQVFDVTSEMRMRVTMEGACERRCCRPTLVADTGLSPDDHGDVDLEMWWEVASVEPHYLYTVSIEFFHAGTGQPVGRQTRTSLVLPYDDPMLDPPTPRLLFPVPRDHEEYPSVQAEHAVLEAHSQGGRVRPGQATVILLNDGVGGFFGRLNEVRTTIDFPGESYRKVCPMIMPHMAIAGIFTSDGKEVIRLPDYTLFWAGNFSAEEIKSLPSLRPVADDGSLSVLYPVPTWWTQAARPPPLRIGADGTLGPPDESMPVMGFMAKEHPEGFVPINDLYEGPPPGTFDSHWLRAPAGRRVTVVVTSCGRLPGLRRTVTSLMAANTYPIDRYLIIEDSGDMRVGSQVIEEFGDVFDIIINKKRMGQLYSIDKAYSLVDTDYIFHCEDDWVFNRIPLLIDQSISILEHDSKVFTVHASNTSFLYPIDNFLEETPEGIQYHKIMNIIPNAKDGWPHWSAQKQFWAFDFHPGLRRTSDYRQYLRPIQGFFGEEHINTWLYWHGFYIVKLPHRYCNHLDINSISRFMEYNGFSEVKATRLVRRQAVPRRVLHRELGAEKAEVSRQLEHLKKHLGNTAEKVGEETIVEFLQQELLYYQQVDAEKAQARRHGKEDQGLVMSHV